MVIRTSEYLKTKYLITALPDNVDNLFVVLFTWNLNQELLIINRFIELEDQTKIKSDEANQIITQYKISMRSYINFIDAF